MNDPTMFQCFSEIKINNDLGMYYCGKRINTVNHIYGPEIRNHYQFVFVNKGTAVTCDSNQIHFGKHDLFVMFPDKRIHYKALEPWSIHWIGLYGDTVHDFVKALGITPENPITHISLYNELNDIMERIYLSANDISLSSKLFVTGLIYEFFSILVQNSNLDAKKINSVKTALRIIDYNYSSPISIEQIANRLSLNTSYFSRIFTGQVGASPKQYLLNKRMERAKELLTVTNASIFEISNSVGYEDQFYFCRIFKKYTGLSPIEYRKKHHKQ